MGSEMCIRDRSENEQQNIGAMIFAIFIFLVLPWLAVFNGASHYVNGDSETKMFLNILSQKGFVGFTMSFAFSYSITLTILVTITEFMTLNRSIADGLEKLGFVFLVLANLSAVPLAFQYNPADPPEISLWVFGVSMFLILLLNIYSLISGKKDDSPTP